MAKHGLFSVFIAALLLLPIGALAADDTFDSDGIKIHYVTEGSGDAVVLIHGWMGDSTTWGRDSSGNTKLDTRGAKDFQLIALDCRGHGKSDKPHDPAKYGKQMAEDVVRLLDHLKIKKAHLIGYSMGAFIAGNVAANHPDRVLSVVYGGQAPIIASNKPTDWSEVDAFARAVEAGKGLGSYLVAVMPANRPKPTLEQANMMAKYLYAGKDVEAFAASGKSFQALEVTGKLLRKCKAPMLFVHGGNESDYVKNCVAIAIKALGRGEEKIIEGTDHITTLSNPKFAAALEEFLAANKSK